MEYIKELIYEVDYILIFALFGGLAVTVFTIRKGEDDYE